MSGLGCGIAYSKIFATQGAIDVIKAAVTRASRIYIYYALTSAATIMLVSTAGLRLETFPGIAVDSLLDALWSAIFLVTPPFFVGVLVLYIALTIIVVPTFICGGDRHRILVLTTSGLMWATAQVLSGFTAPLSNRWHFNPFAWQFLFMIGLFVGSRYRSSQPILASLSLARFVRIVAWPVVVSAFIYRLLAANLGFGFTSLRFDEATLAIMKQDPSPLRLLHFLSVTLLVATYFRKNSFILKWPISLLLIQTGMHSLELFSLTVVLDVLENILVTMLEPSLRERVLMDGIAFTLMALTAIGIHRRKIAVST